MLKDEAIPDINRGTKSTEGTCRAGGSSLTVVRPFPEKGGPGVLPWKILETCWCILVLFERYLINNHNLGDGTFMVNNMFQIH